MRVAGHELYAYRLPFRRPVTWFRSTEQAGEFVALRLVGNDGSRGVAEAAVKPTWSGLSVRALAALVEDVLLPALMETDVSDLRAVRRALAVFPDNQLAKMLVINACAVLAADAARPRTAAPGSRRSVDVSWCVTRQGPAAMAHEAAEMVTRHGFRTLKLKGGQGLEVDRAVLREVRAAVGDGIALTVDANGAYALDEARNYLAILAGENVVLAEDPAPFAPDAAFTALAAASPVPLLVDMPCITAVDAEAFIAAGATAISIKPGRVGFAEAEAIASIAGARGIGVCSGMYAESALGSLVSLHFAAGLTDAIAPAEQSFYLTMTEQVLTTPLAIVGGRIDLPDLADLDRLVDWRKLQRSAI